MYDVILDEGRHNETAKGDYDQTIADCSRAAELDPENAPQHNFPPEIVFAILEECRRRVAAGKLFLEAFHFRGILDIVGKIYEQVKENEKLKLGNIIDDIDYLYRNIDSVKRENEEEVVFWNKIFRQWEHAPD
jgi:hypothetical protein